MNTLIRSPPAPAPLSQYNAYTTWPGGVDPTAPLFNTDNQFKMGGAKARRASRRALKSRSIMTRRRRRNTMRRHRK